MRRNSVWGQLLGIHGAIVETVRWEDGVVVVGVRRRAYERGRCGVCRRRCPGYDGGRGRRRWRALDLGATKAYVEADAPRVACRRHGVVVCAAPWARHESRYTKAFEDQVAWLAVVTSKTATAMLMRMSWRSVGTCLERVADELYRRGGKDRLNGLRRIGIDEVSYRKGRQFLTVVVCHDTGRLVWAEPGHDRATVLRFLGQLKPRRCREIELVSADMAPWISGPIAEKCPNATLCLDPFHVVQLATKALDLIRRETWNEARRQKLTDEARAISRSRFALRKNPANLTDRQQVKLSMIQQTNKRLYRAYLIKEQLRQIYVVQPAAAAQLLDQWLTWACRSRLAPFVKLSRTIRAHRAGILAAIQHGLSNGRIEQLNTQLRLIIRRAYGFHGPDPLIALAMLSLGDRRPTLPGRT